MAIADMGPAQDSLQRELTTLVENLLSVLSSATPEAEPKEVVEFQARLMHHRHRLRECRDARQFQLEAEACTETCEKYLQRSLGYHTRRESELSEMIAILREASGLMAGESTKFNQQIIASSERMSALVKLDEMRVLKKQLATQLSQLKRAAEDKQRRDDEARARLNKRVEVLQYRLQQVQEEASLDALTRIANRGGFDRTLRRMVAGAKQAEMPLTLAMIDIDNFKHVNDMHGHLVGDRVLLCTAIALSAGTRQTDFLARYGGEEFAILMANCTVAQAEQRMTLLLQEIAKNTYDYDADGATGRVRFTVSCGVTELAPNDTEEEFVRRADQALYEAKRQGKNRVAAKKRPLLGGLLG